MKKIAALTASCIVLTWFSCPQAKAELYQWLDGNGNVVISDNPPPGSAAKRKEFTEERVFRQSLTPRDYGPDDAAGQATPAAEPDRKRKADYSSVRVILYYTKWCGYCKKAKEYLLSLGTSPAEYDVEADSGKAEEMLSKSGGSRSVPVIDIEGTIIKGFNPEAIKATLDSCI